MPSKCAGSPGVPASTSRNGALAPRTSWLAFSSAVPTSKFSMWASSSSTANGRRRQREATASAKLLRPFGEAHSAEPIDAMPTLRGSSLASRRRGAKASNSAR